MKAKAFHEGLGTKSDSEDVMGIIQVIPLHPMNHIQRCGLTVTKITTFLGLLKILDLKNALLVVSGKI
jgi:hypothetical protein